MLGSPVQAAIASGKPENELLLVAQNLVSTIGSYKTAAKHAKKLKAAQTPKAKTQPKAKAK